MDSKYGQGYQSTFYTKMDGASFLFTTTEKLQAQNLTIAGCDYPIPTSNLNN
jgi:hypothetical protein